MGQGRVSRLNPQQAASFRPLTELLQVLMHYMYFPLKSTAHLPADLCNITFAVTFSSTMQE